MFIQKIITIISIIVVLSLVLSVSGCGSLASGARDGVASGIAGMLIGGSSGSGTRMPSAGGMPSSSGNEPERNYSGSTEEVPWPLDSSWARYGLSGLKQPEGTTVTFAALYMGYYMVNLINGGRPALEDLTAQIDKISGSQIITEMMDSGSITVGYSLPEGTVHIVADLENGDITIQAMQ